MMIPVSAGGRHEVQKQPTTFTSSPLYITQADEMVPPDEWAQIFILPQ